MHIVGLNRGLFKEYSLRTFMAPQFDSQQTCGKRMDPKIYHLTEDMHGEGGGGDRQ